MEKKITITIFNNKIKISILGNKQYYQQIPFLVRPIIYLIDKYGYKTYSLKYYDHLSLKFKVLAELKDEVFKALKIDDSLKINIVIETNNFGNQSNDS